VIPAKQATLSKIEHDTGNPIAQYVEETYAMSSSAAATGSFGHGGVYGVKLPNALVVEGNYTFHARAVMHHGGCKLTREVQWSHHVSVGIDPDSTPVTVDTDDSGHVVVTFIPQGGHGNLVGPGEADHFDVDPPPGCTPVGGVVDLGDGSYRQTLDCDPEEGGTPGVVVTQPGRDPIVLVPPTRLRRYYRYVVQFHCGAPATCDCDCSSLAPGRYATSVSLFNGEAKPVPVLMSIVRTTLAGAHTGAWPKSSPVSTRDRMEIGALATTVVDCCTLNELLLGNAPKGPQPELMANVVFESLMPLHVTATYTMVRNDGGGASIDVERIAPEIRELREKSERPQPPARRVDPTPTQPPPRPQDVKRVRKGKEPSKRPPKQ
jgi:hypothetical protein